MWTGFLMLMIKNPSPTRLFFEVPILFHGGLVNSMSLLVLALKLNIGVSASFCWNIMDSSSFERTAYFLLHSGYVVWQSKCCCHCSLLDISLDILSLSLSSVYLSLFFTCILGLAHTSSIINRVPYVYFKHKGD